MKISIREKLRSLGKLKKNILFFIIVILMPKKYISHRANLYKKELKRENKFKHIDEVISQGFDCEIDLWLIEGKLFLGHDSPDTEITYKNILELKNYLWIHCKNLEALTYLTKIKENNLNYFWHQKDDFTLTSMNYIWTYPGKKVSTNSVIVDLNHSKIIEKTLYGICSDNIYEVKKMYEDMGY